MIIKEGEQYSKFNEITTLCRFRLYNIDLEKDERTMYQRLCMSRMFILKLHRIAVVNLLNLPISSRSKPCLKWSNNTFKTFALGGSKILRRVGVRKSSGGGGACISANFPGKSYLFYREHFDPTRVGDPGVPPLNPPKLNLWQVFEFQNRSLLPNHKRLVPAFRWTSWWS